MDTGPVAAAAKSLQSCPTLCNPTDSSPPGSSIPGILQARILEWVAISISMDAGPGICQIPFSSCWVKDRSGDSWLGGAEDQGAKGWEKDKGSSYHCCLPTSMKTFQLSQPIGCILELYSK